MIMKNKGMQVYHIHAPTFILHVNFFFFVLVKNFHIRNFYISLENIEVFHIPGKLVKA